MTDAVKQLEARLGVSLLQRNTRYVSPTLDGEAYYQRCLAILADIEDAEGAFVGTKPKGLLRVDVHGTLARHFVLPGLPAFLETCPDIEFYMRAIAWSISSGKGSIAYCVSGICPTVT